jgi:transposase InsO family protein
MIEPFKKAQGGYTHILVAIDKFTKWIEYKPIVSLTSAKVVEFIQEIMFRFGIPNSIITNLGSNFTSSEFFDFCEQRIIQIKYASVAHPIANGQVERANGMILDTLKNGIRQERETCREVDQGTAIRGLEPTNAAQPSSVWIHPVLHGVCVGGSVACRSGLWGA